MSVNRVQATLLTRKADSGSPTWGIAMCILVLLPKWVICTTAVMWVLFYLIEAFARHNSLYPRTFHWAYQTFWVIDIVFNATTGTLWFMELPKGSPRWYIETFSDRIRRHYKHEARGWRHNLAALFREPINWISAGHI